MMRIAAIITSVLFALAGIALIYVYTSVEIYHDNSLPAVASIVIAGSIGCLFLFTKKKYREGLSVLFVIVILFQLWGFTIGAELMERKRTLRGFAQEVNKALEGIQEDRIFVYQHGMASLLFYLNRPSPITNVNTVDDIERRVAQHPDGYLIIDLTEATTPRLVRCLNQMTVVCRQNSYHLKREQFALLRFH